jgi:hypothetical protein
MVDRRGAPVATWDAYLTDEIRAAMERPPAARVGGEPLSGDYLHHLAESGDFATFGEIREFLIAEERRRRDLRSRGLRLYPDEVRAHLFALPPEDRYAIARLEASYPLELAGRPAGAGGRRPIELSVVAEDEDGRAFGDLLELDRRYVASVSEGRLSGLELRTVRSRTTGRLGFMAGAAITLQPVWRATPGEAVIELLEGDAVTRTWTVPAGSRGSTGTRVRPEDRPARPGTVIVRVRVDGQPPVTRGFWQRGVLDERRPPAGTPRPRRGARPRRRDRAVRRSRRTA